MQEEVGREAGVRGLLVDPPDGVDVRERVIFSAVTTLAESNGEVT